MRYKKFMAFGVVALSAVVLSACKANSLPTGDNTNGNSNVSTTASDSTQKGAATVSATDAGFDPKTVTVNAGEAITWVNNSSRAIQIASDPHPTHSDNPQVTGGQFTVEVKVGESKTVGAGTKIGSWGIHDHLKPSAKATVVVK